MGKHQDRAITTREAEKTERDLMREEIACLRILKAIAEQERDHATEEAETLRLTVRGARSAGKELEGELFDAVSNEQDYIERIDAYTREVGEMREALRDAFVALETHASSDVDDCPECGGLKRRIARLTRSSE